MTKQKKNKAVTVVAVFLMALAAFLTVMLFVVDDGSDKESDTKPSVVVDSAEESETDYSHSTTFAPAKYLWEYGPGDSKYEKPSELK